MPFQQLLKYRFLMLTWFFNGRSCPLDSAFSLVSKINRRFDMTPRLLSDRLYKLCKFPDVDESLQIPAHSELQPFQRSSGFIYALFTLTPCNVLRAHPNVLMDSESKQKPPKGIRREGSVPMSSYFPLYLLDMDYSFCFVALRVIMLIRA